MATSLNLAECMPKIRTETHHEKAGTLQYLSTTRDLLKIMEESQELYEFPMDLFDGHCDIRPRLAEGGVFLFLWLFLIPDDFGFLFILGDVVLARGCFRNLEFGSYGM